MYNKITSLFILSIFTLFVACSESEDTELTFSGDVEMATDVKAGTDTTGGFTFYNLSTNSIVSDSDSATSNWDVAFKDAGFEIFIITNNGISGPGNGGAILVDQDFEIITEVPNDDQFKVDTDNEFAINAAPGGWWIYTGTQQEPNHAVLPKDPHTIFVRTATGDYAKLEVLSYYEGNPDTSTPEFANLGTRPASGYFTFRFELLEN